MKKSGVEPSVAGVVARCPDATQNPATGQPFTPKYVYAVFRSYCTDDGPDTPWNQNPLQKTALPPFLIDARYSWARKILALLYTKAWFAQHCVWFDPCSSIVPGAPRSAFDANQASYSKGKRWMSKDKEAWSRNPRVYQRGAQ